jgi:esterase FrsA
MNDVAELKRYIELHAKGQGIRHYQKVLDRIGSDGDGPGSWAYEWSLAAERLEQSGRHLEACRHYAMARFPYADGPARKEAHTRCLGAFDRWRAGHPDIERLNVDMPDGTIPCWTSGLSATGKLPVLLIMGGIVSVKEQWAPALAGIRKLGMAGIVAEMPGVGENPLRYKAESWRMLSHILDAVSDRADVTQTYALALSFSGHMALRCAVDDARIRGVITVGAPVSEFFTNRAWQLQVPRITTDTLAHMMGLDTAEIPGAVGDWAITRQQLAALDIPVCYTSSRRDEIIPPGEVGSLRDGVRDIRLVQHDDVHGSPRHVAETQLWSISSLLSIRHVRGPQAAAVGLLLRAQQARARLAALTRR